MTIGAMIDKEWDLVANASGGYEAMMEKRNWDLNVALQNIATQAQATAHHAILWFIDKGAAHETSMCGPSTLGIPPVIPCKWRRVHSAV